MLETCNCSLVCSWQRQTSGWMFEAPGEWTPGTREGWRNTWISFQMCFHIWSPHLNLELVIAGLSSGHDVWVKFNQIPSYQSTRLHIWKEFGPVRIMWSWQFPHSYAALLDLFHSSSKPSLSLVCPRGVVTEMSFTLNKVHLARLNLIFLHCDRRTKVWTNFVLDKVFSSTVASTTAKSLGCKWWEGWESFC